jgi:hypothetical protein
LPVVDLKLLTAKFAKKFRKGREKKQDRRSVFFAISGAVLRGQELLVTRTPVQAKV